MGIQIRRKASLKRVGEKRIENKCRLKRNRSKEFKFKNEIGRKCERS